MKNEICFHKCKVQNAIILKDGIYLMPTDDGVVVGLSQELLLQEADSMV